MKTMQIKVSYSSRFASEVAADIIAAAKELGIELEVPAQVHPDSEWEIGRLADLEREAEIKGLEIVAED